MSKNRFTIFDAMEKSGVFDRNPANTFARDPVTGASLYKGPVQYPKMLYHPLGSENVIVPGEWVKLANGDVKLLGEQKEIVWQLVENEAEEAALRSEGWHDHPAKAVRARIEKGIVDGVLPKEALKAVPPISSDQRIKDLEAELARLQAQQAPSTDDVNLEV